MMCRGGIHFLFQAQDSSYQFRIVLSRQIKALLTFFVLCYFILSSHFEARDDEAWRYASFRVEVYLRDGK